jgi:O-antigen ligase
VVEVAAKTLFLVMIFSLAFMWPNLHFRQYAIPVTDLAFPLVVLIWIVAVIFGAAPVVWDRFYLVLLPFLAAVLLSTVFSESRQASMIKLLGELYLIGLAVLTLNVVRTLRMQRYVIYVWLAATAVAGMVSIVSLALFYVDRSSVVLNYTLSQYGTLPPGNYPRISSTFLNPNMFCNYLNISVVLLFAAFTLGWISKKVFLPLLAIFAAAILLTISPGVGGVLLSTGIWLWIAYQKKGTVARLSLFAGLAAAFVFFIAILISPSANTLAAFHIEPIRDLHVYSSERVSAWIAALHTIFEHPVVGRGIGLSSGMAYSYDATGSLHSVNDAHQIWLNFGAQTGLVGLLALGLLAAYLIYRSLPFRFDGSPATALRIAFGVSFLGAFIYQGLGGSFEDARHVWVLMGLLAACPRAGSESEVLKSEE